MEERCQEFEQTLKSNPIVVVSMPGCEPCRRAKAVLKANKFEYHDIDVYSNEDIFECVYDKTQVLTVPQIFINEKFIGGSTQLFDKFNNKSIYSEVNRKNI